MYTLKESSGATVSFLFLLLEEADHCTASKLRLQPPRHGNFTGAAATVPLVTASGVSGEAASSLLLCCSPGVVGHVDQQ